MSFEADLKSHLSVAGIGALAGDRVYPTVRPQDSGLPAVTYSHVSGRPSNSLDGYTSGLQRFLMQIDCWAKSHSEVMALATAVRDRMNTAAATFSTVITEYPLLDDYEPDTKLYRRSLGVACWYRENA
jgi:hypothetical protein